MKRGVLLVAAVLLLALAVPTAAFAGGQLDGRVILGGEFTLASGETLDGDLVVLGGNADTQQGSLVTGSIFIAGGNLQIDGTVNGDVSILGGNVNLMSHAVVKGDVNSVGGNISRAEGAQVMGQVVTGQGFNMPFHVEPFTNTPGGVQVPFSGGRIWADVFRPLAGFAWGIFQSLMLAALAVLIVMFAPVATARVSDAIVDQPIIAGGLGILTVIGSLALIVLLCVTICLIPFGLLGLTVLIVAWVFGWIAVGLEVGKRLGAMLNWQLHPAGAAGLGTLIVGLVADGIGFIPCVGWIASALVGAIGLGGVVLTRFGTRRYEAVPLAATAVEEVPPPSPRASKRSKS
jgi:cytoskeletal protein CcmA (bactofilin family)